MWLLRTDTLELKSFVDERATKYAILSHTWGGEEVTFQEMRGVHPVSKKGYRKIQQTCQQALRDRWKYVWIDTCCINKESSAELSEAINSMFSYYASAQVCYVYMADVVWKHASEDMPCGDGTPHSDRVFYTTLEHARWFQRGWTLQELIAPSRLVFFDSSWHMIGTRRKMRKPISALTRIDEDLLKDRRSPDDAPDLETYSIAARMSWAAYRDTTRLEDRAYSLLGLFGINMPLLYGEGMNAFQRLQEEIISHTDDQSIFAWEGFYKASAPVPLFALTPNAFAKMSRVVRWPHGQRSGSLTMSSGIEIELPVVDKFSADGSFAVLNCHFRGDLTGPLAICVRCNEDNKTARRLECVVQTYGERSSDTKRIKIITHVIASHAKVRLIHLQPRVARHTYPSLDAKPNTQWDGRVDVWVHTSEHPVVDFEALDPPPRYHSSQNGYFELPGNGTSTLAHRERGCRFWSIGTRRRGSHLPMTGVGLVFATSHWSQLWFGLLEVDLYQGRVRDEDSGKNLRLYDASSGDIHLDVGVLVGGIHLRVTARGHLHTTIMGYRVHEIVLSASVSQNSVDRSVESDELQQSQLDQLSVTETDPPVEQLKSPSKFSFVTEGSPGTDGRHSGLPSRSERGSFDGGWDR